MFNSISIEELDQLLKKETINLIDVRERFEYDRGHVPGAKNMPMSELEQTYTQLNQNQPYMIICQSGNRSHTACQFLTVKGYNVTNILGGTSAWRYPLA